MKSKDTSLITFTTAYNFADIVFGEFRDNLQVDLEVAQKIVDRRLSFTNEKLHYLVLDMSNVRAITTEAKNYLQAPETGLKHILGAALVASNPVSAMIANIFIKTPKDFQAKFFNNKKEAFDWICKQRQKNIKLELGN
jgi:hypothetical protein